jgi:uncharacterized protein (TIGR00251 family)
VSRESGWYRYDAAGERWLLRIHVQAKARRNEATGLHGDALKLRIAAPAADNKANAALIEFLAEALDLAKAAIAIRHGATSRHKSVAVIGGTELEARIKALAASRITTHDPRITPST